MILGVRSVILKKFFIFKRMHSVFLRKNILNTKKKVFFYAFSVVFSAQHVKFLVGRSTVLSECTNHSWTLQLGQKP